MRKLQLGTVCLALLPTTLACNDDKYPVGDIGYGASDGTGTSSGATGGRVTSGGTGNMSANGGQAGKSAGHGGSSGSAPVSNDGGAGDTPMGNGTCEQAWSAPPPDSDCDLDALEDSGVTLGEDNGTYRIIASDTTLESGKSYKLDGLTIVQPGVTLTIPKCVKILGLRDVSVLLTDAGIQDLGGGKWGGKPPGRLVAIGEPNAPIVMTSSKPVGQRRPGDWGGLVLAGKAPENVWRNTDDRHMVPLPSIVEGILNPKIPYGWQTDDYADEDSGTLKYVRVEYVGHPTADSKETNGVTLCAVGRGTTISHVMVSNAIDDCFEWFGGTVNADHLVAYNCDDDGFDTDLGYSGKVQFGFIRQFPTSLEADSNGFEWDNNPDNSAYKPYNVTAFSNMTACGGHTGQFLVNPRYGAVLRRGIRGSLLNTLITGFDSGGLSVRDPDNSNPSITHSTVFDNAALFDPADTLSAAFSADPAGWFLNQDGNSSDAPPNYCDCWANPPLPFPLAKIQGGTPGADFPEPDADFQGAFKDSTPASNWMSGSWVDWAEN